MTGWEALERRVPDLAHKGRSNCQLPVSGNKPAPVLTWKLLYY